MGWTYTGNDKLARAATRLYELRGQPCKISPFVFMSDPERVPDVLAVARNLPEGATLIYRHFGAEDRLSVGQELRQISFARNLQFLVGQDVELAAEIWADGVHLPERELARGAVLRRRFPDWLVTGAAHSIQAVHKCMDNNLDAALFSPVFASESASAGEAFGVKTLAGIVNISDIPVIALGGINTQTVDQLVGSGAAGIAGVSMFVGGHG